MVAGLLQPGGGITIWVGFLLRLLFLKAVCPILSKLKHLPLYGLIGNTVFPDSMCTSNMSVSDSAPRGRHRTPWYWEMTHNLRRVSSAGYLNAPQLLPLLANPNNCNWKSLTAVGSVDGHAHAVKRARLNYALRHAIYPQRFTIFERFSKWREEKRASTNTWVPYKIKLRFLKPLKRGKLSVLQIKMCFLKLGF